MNDAVANFADLSPDRVIESVERALGRPFTGFTSPLPSYINRVYELQSLDGERLIAKFYRPGRWSLQALRDEHRFLSDCREDDIPVISPLELSDGSTLGDCYGISFAVFPKRAGRQFEIIDDSDWERLGSLVARVHLAGDRATASGRISLHPAKSTRDDLRELTVGDLLPADLKEDFRMVCEEILEIIIPLFESCEMTRIHGDLHAANLISRPQEGLMLIDFDDMAMGPPVQDLWLLLPGHVWEVQYEIDLMLRGYEKLRHFEEHSLNLIEPLRAMRIIYFLAWCARQRDDFRFRKNFPDWGSRSFWITEINDLKKQLERLASSGR